MRSLRKLELFAACLILIDGISVLKMNNHRGKGNLVKNLLPELNQELLSRASIIANIHSGRGEFQIFIFSSDVLRHDIITLIVRVEVEV